MVNNMIIEKTINTFDEYMETLDVIDQKRINLKIAIASKMIMARNKKGLSQHELAELTGMKQPAIARMESFIVVPRVDTLNAYLQPLGYKVDIVPIAEQEVPIHTEPLATTKQPTIHQNAG